MRVQNWWFLGLLVGGLVPILTLGAAVFEYPSDLTDAFDADQSCWTGMSSHGTYPVSIVPHAWLVGPPPSELTAVTIPENHWIDLLFSGVLVDGPDDDIEMVESGKAGEEAIVFLTDGAECEYALGIVKAEKLHVQALTYISMELPEIEVPWPLRGVRLVGTDHGGQSPGFDVGSVQARISHACDSIARHPNPVGGQVNTPIDVNLVWTPVCEGHEQLLYFSEVRSLVETGDSTVAFRIEPPDANDIEPPHIQLGRTYFWRIDTVSQSDTNDIAAGEVWSFTTTDYVMIDDFDAYGGSSAPSLREAWPTRSWGGNTIESGDIFRSCRQSMVFTYYYDSLQYSETYHDFASPQDWTHTGDGVLRFWIYGKHNNDTQGQMYVTLSDGQNEQQQRFAGDVQALTRPEWMAWDVPLRDFNDVNLAGVTRLTFGLNWPDAQVGQFGSGTVYIDDISICAPQCSNAHRPNADLTSDCIVDHTDVQQIAAQWLYEPVGAVSVSPPGDPVLWYRFDENASDSTGFAHGQVSGRPTYEDGVHGQAIRFLNPGDAVEVGDAARVFQGIHDAITIAFWQYGEDSSHLNDTLCCSNYTYGVANPSIAIHLGCWRRPGRYRWDCGTPWSYENRLAGRHGSSDEWTGRWNHWVFTKDAQGDAENRRSVMRIYLNGRLYDSRFAPDAPIDNITSFVIGTGWYGRYDGLIDDFQIYDRALNEPQAAYLATDGTGELPYPESLPADLNSSGAVDFRDFAVLAEQWLHSGLWP